MKRWRSVIRDLAPPILLRALKPTSAGSIKFVGSYPNWGAALANASGYGSDQILERTRDAALMIARGEAVYERDSVLFDHVEFSFPVLAALLRCACAANGRLSVVDFGGSLGTSYRQFKAFRPSLRELQWSIVEQPRYVECGQRHFENEELRFFDSLAAAVNRARPDAVLLSGVLQYLEDPRALLREIAALTSADLIIDRTYCTASPDDVLTVQVVPPSIYDASYPCWIFSQSQLRKDLANQYSLLTPFVDKTHRWTGPPGEFDLMGFVLERRS